MKSKMGQFSVNLNPMLSVARDGTVLYSNETSDPLLQEWGAAIGEKLPSIIVDLVQSVISRNSPEKIEVKVGNKLYLVVFSPLPEEQRVSISGFDISDQKELEKEMVSEAREKAERDTLVEELRKSEEKYRSIVETAQEGIWLIDQNDRTVFVNQKMSDMLGFSIDEILEQSPQKFMAPEFRIKAEDRLIEHIRGTKHVIDYRFIRKDGSNLWCILSSSPLFDDQGKYSGSLAMITDITERKRAEEALKRSEALYRAIAKHLPNAGVYVFDQDLRFLIVEGPGSALPIGFADKKSLEGKTVWDLDKQTREIVEPRYRRVLAGESFHYETNYHGQIIRTDYVPIFNEEGKVMLGMAIPVDITERKRAEEALRESEAKYRGLFDLMSEACELMELVYDDGKPVDYIFLDVNPAWERMTGLKKEQVIGRKASEAVGSVESYWPEAMDRALKTDEIVHIDNYGVALDKWYSVSMWKFSETACGVTITDITESKKAEEALRIANETLEERVQERTSELKQAYKFLKKIETIRKKEIHHRIKNNLQVISSLLDLQAEKFNNKECIKDSEVLEAFKESQNRVISMALIHEELHRGGEVDTLNFSQYIVELADNLFLAYKFGSEGIVLDMDIEENIFFDMDTSIPLGIIVNELVSNSLKHAFSGREKGEIKIKLHRGESKECIESISEDCKSTNFILTISDNGIGIPEELDIEDLDSLGFQLVISLVDQLDGEFELKRNNGTEFTMRFTVTEKDDLAQVDLKPQECTD